MSVKSTAGSRGSHRRILIIISLILVVTVLVSSLFVYRTALVDDGFVRVKTATELRNAINSAEVGVPTTLALTKDISLGPALTIPAGADITLTSVGRAGFFKLIGLNGQNVITVENGGLLTLDGIIVTHEGTEGVGVCVAWGGKFVMVDGEILDNNALRGAGVLNFGTFELVGGKISGNTVTWLGGGVFTVGYFVMSGGEISGNNAVGTDYNNGGGGVGVDYRGYFVMSGGEISRNISAREGGGVYIDGGLFDRSGGEISGNVADVDNDVYYSIIRP